MSFTYEYTGDQKTVFIFLEKDGQTFAPEKGETITTNEAVGHLLLKLVVSDPVTEDAPTDVPITEDTDSTNDAATTGLDEVTIVSPYMT